MAWTCAASWKINLEKSRFAIFAVDVLVVVIVVVKLFYCCYL
jgi:hypothetical protein